jgi:hypothetical protein
MPKPDTESTPSTNPRASDDRKAPRQCTGAAQPPPGLDEGRHKASQKTAQQADLLRDGLFAALMATAADLPQFDSAPAYNAYLTRLLEDFGSPSNPIAKMLVEQLALAHIRIAQLHGSAALATELEAAKTYATMAARLTGEFRRSAIALDVLTSRSSDKQSKAKLKVLKMAQ